MPHATKELYLEDKEYAIVSLTIILKIRIISENPKVWEYTRRYYKCHLKKFKLNLF